MAHLVKTKTGEPLQHAAGAARCNKKAKDTQKRENASKTELFKAVRCLFDCKHFFFLKRKLAQLQNILLNYRHSWSKVDVIIKK